MKKWNTPKTLTLLFVVAALLCGIGFVVSSKSSSKVGLYAKTFSIDDGYGYKIIHEDKVLIQQNYIPAVQGTFPFKTANDAEQVGELVKKRLLEGKSPVISLNDLTHLKIDILKE